MSDGFLGRWSRRKLDSLEGKPVAEEPERPAAEAALPPVQEPSPPEAPAAPAADPVDASVAEAPPPPPTLEDVRALTAESDFSRFAARDVAPEVKNAAFRKLFSDPHYNVMDGLDVYIDDYSKPQPLPSHLARQLAGAAFLRLFDAPASDEHATPQSRDVADNRPPDSVAQSGSDSAETATSQDADPDLRLQQDDAAESGEPGAGAA
jgi:hypothetical protein